MGNWCHDIQIVDREWCMYSSDELLQRSREGNFCVYFPSCEATRQINTRITWVSGETVRHESACTIVFLTLHSESINDSKNDDLYTSSPCLTRSVFALLITSQSIPDDVTITKQLCDQADLRTLLSTRPSVRLSVCLSQLIDYVPLIVSSWNFQELLPLTKVTSMQKVKVRGQRLMPHRSRPNLAVSGP